MTKLKNFSIKFAFVLLSLLLLSACQPKRIGPRIYPKETHRAPTSAPTYKKLHAEKAPWEVWTNPTYSNPSYNTATRFEEEGDLDAASEHLAKALQSAKSSEEAEYYVLKLSSVDLKRGEASSALSRISKYAQRRKVEANQLDPRFSLLTAYCYLKSKNSDQVFAWLLQSFKSSRGTGSLAEESRSTAREYIKTLDSIELNNAYYKWEKESFVASIIREEKSRRLQGGSLLSSKHFDKYFNSYFYKLDPIDRVDSSVLTLPQPLETQTEISAPSLTSMQEIKLGALLPLTGQYAHHAKKVEEGIRLALKENNLENDLIVLDSNNQLLEKYAKLSRDEHVQIIFGPMLVKDVELLSTLQNQLDTPLLTYAKKRGLPALSDKIFRLGGTAENQLLSLISYAQNNLNPKKIALLYTDEEIGHEYNEAMQAIIARNSFSVQLNAFPYQSRSLTQINLLRDRLVEEGYDSFIIADSLPSAESILRSFKDLNNNSINILAVSLLSDLEKAASYHFIMEGVYVVSLFNSQSTDPDILQFVSQYKATYGREPDLLAAQSYDSVKLVLSALQGKMNSNVIDSIKENSVISGTTGTMHVLMDGDIHRDLKVLKFSNGIFLELPNQ